MSESSQCSQCGPFPQNSLHYEFAYQTSVPLQRLRESNLPGTDEEMAHVTAFLGDIHRESASLEAKFAFLSRVMASIKEERDALRTLEDKCRSLVSAHRAIPRELWSDIFLYAQSEHQDFDPLDPSGIIWQLSHVCQAWRDAALSLSSFWSRISLTFGQYNHKEKMVQLLQLVLGRSRLLDISLHYASCSWYLEPFRARILDMVLSQSHRWRSAHLDDSRVPGVFQLTGLYAPICGRLPQLSSLTVNAYVGGANVQLFEDCPLLTKVTLSCCAVNLPVAQIRELQIGTPAYSHGYEGIIRASLALVRQCPVLEVLCVYTDPSDEDAVQSRGDIVPTPTIQKLETDSLAIINNLVLPSLREAAVYKSEPSVDQPPYHILDHLLESFQQLLHRSDCTRTLTHLKLVNITLRPYRGPYEVGEGSSPLVSLLVQTTQLAVLELNLSSYRYAMYMYAEEERLHLAELMIALRVTEPNGILLPCLSSVKISMKNLTGWLPSVCRSEMWGDFPAMLKARWEGDGLARLHTFHLALRDVVTTIPWGDDPWGQHTRRWSMTTGEHAVLDGLIEAGMNLNLDIQYNAESDIVHNYAPPHVEHRVKVPR